MKNGRRRPSCDGTSRMTRECQVRICERLGVKYPGPTRHSLPMHSAPVSNNVRYASDSDHSRHESDLTRSAGCRLERCRASGMPSRYTPASWLTLN